MKHVTFIFFLMCLPISSQAADSLFLLQDNCVRCHLTGETPSKVISAITWKKSVHFGPDTGCSDCHGGNKFLKMDFKKGHMGLPENTEVNAMCGKCHITEYKNMKIRNTFSLKTRKQCEATCITCHGYHDTKKATLSVINRQNCTTCHDYTKAELLDRTIQTIQSKLDELEYKIITHKEKDLPVEAPMRELENIHMTMATAFHSRMSENLLTYLNTDIMNALSEVDRKMAYTAPGKWMFQGILVLLFLCLCLILIKYYQMVVLPCSGESEITDQ